MVTSFPAVFFREWKRVVPRSLGKGWTAPVLNLVALAFVFIFIPWMLGLAFLNAFVVIVFAMLSIFFVADLTAASFASDQGRRELQELVASRASAKALLAAKSAAIVSFSWMCGLLALAVCFASVNVFNRGGGLLLPPAPVLADASILSLAACCAVGLMAVLVSLRSRSAQAAQGATKLSLMSALLLIFNVYWFMPEQWKSALSEQMSASGITKLVWICSGILFGIAAALFPVAHRRIARGIETRQGSGGLRTAMLSVVSLNVLYFAGFLAFPAAAARILIFAGRGPSCETTQAMQAFQRRLQQKDIEKAIVERSRLTQRDPGGYQLWETPKGAFWEPTIEGTAILPQIAEMEAKYLAAPENPIRAGDIVLDCGANVGVFTREALRQGAAVVVAIEPAPQNLECLRRNFAQESAAGRVIVYPKGVWDKDDFLTLGHHETTTAMDSFVVRDHTREGVKVPLTTIDKLVRELNLPRVDFIKMDIEGAEQRALAGAEQTIRQYRPRMEISVNHLPEDPVNVPAVIAKAQPGYRIDCLQCELHPQSFRLQSEILYFRLP
ncbi:MAG: FkbM family methyltransferase [Bryobacteraceae bacterium]